MWIVTRSFPVKCAESVLVHKERHQLWSFLPYAVNWFRLARRFASFEWDDMDVICRFFSGRNETVTLLNQESYFGLVNQTLKPREVRYKPPRLSVPVHLHHFLGSSRCPIPKERQDPPQMSFPSRRYLTQKGRWLPPRRMARVVPSRQGPPLLYPERKCQHCLTKKRLWKGKWNGHQNISTKFSNCHELIWVSKHDFNIKLLLGEDV